MTEKKTYKSKSDLNAIEEQTLLYARDLAKMFMERKEKERQLNLTKQQLAQSAKIALLGELAAGIAHEINNALTPAIGNLSILLLDRSNFSEKVVERLESIEESMMRASSMLQQILDFSRKKPEKRQPVDISTVLERSLFLLKYKFTKNQIMLEKDLQSELSKILADDSQIEQVFTNLILNAIDAMEPGGTLRITANNRAGKSADDQPYVEMVFEDTGRGIPPEIMEYVFEPFYTTKGKGTGLGLFISYRIVEKHGGMMDVTSTSGQGTRFRVCLPAS
jgi:two-component system NtrC family sensor kinase